MKILISGYKGSGKDTAADILCKHGFEKISLAKVLKDETAKKYNLDRSLFDDVNTKDAPLYNYPMVCLDSNTAAINTLLSLECRNLNGEKPLTTTLVGQHMVGRFPYSAALEPLYWTPRALLILEGSTARSVQPDYWASRLDLTGNKVISDWRFKNEHVAIMNKVGLPAMTTLRINRTINTSKDPSEIELDDFMFDKVISNTGTIEDLAEALKPFFLF